jgi:hypothetical protein
MDDLFVIWLSMKLVRRLVAPKLLEECRERAAAVSFAIRFSGRAFYARLPETALSAPDSRGDRIATESDRGASSRTRP